jgi:hypothetical protein
MGEVITKEELKQRLKVVQHEISLLLAVEKQLQELVAHCKEK